MKPLSCIRRALILLSLILCVASIILWRRSYHIADVLSLDRDRYAADGSVYRSYSSIASARGQFNFGASRIAPKLFPRLVHKNEGVHFQQVPVSHYGTDSEPRLWSWLGFSYLRSDAPDLIARRFTAPFWFTTVLFAIAPILWLIKRLRGRQRLSGKLCPTCGYDLRATPSLCPECGSSP